MIKIIWEVPPLRTISWGGFVCGVGLSSTFFIIPLILSQNGIDSAQMWQIYLPMLILGGITMLLASYIADVKNFFKEVMLIGVIFMLISIVFLFLGFQNSSVAIYIAALYLFFMGFNIFEPILPSLVSRIAKDHARGTAVGVYNFAQFFGHFVGATLAGMLYLNNYLTVKYVVVNTIEK